MENFIMIFVILSLSSCKIDFKSLIDLSETYLVSINENGKYSKEYTMSLGNEKHSQFIVWFKENQSDWDPTPVSYVPNVVVQGKKFSLNFMNKVVILNYEKGQFIKDINLNDYEYLLQ